MPGIRGPHLCAVLLALTVAAYLPLWQNDFIDFDDEQHITANPRVKEGLSGPNFVWAWTNYHGNYWMPLSWLSLQLDAHLFSTRAPGGTLVLSPAAFHGENLCWHLASVLLLFRLWLRLTGARWRSFLVAALFAVHPMHVESVAWAAERKDVLSVFFGILTLLAYVRYRERPGGMAYLALMLSFLLSLLAKPMLMTLPFVLLLLDWWPLGRLSVGTARPPDSVRRLVWEKVPLFVLAGLVAIVTVVFRQRAGTIVPLEELPLSARLANAGAAYGWYLSATFWPWPLAILYPHPMSNWSVSATLAGTLALLALTGLSCWQARRRPWLLVGWLWFAGSLVPVIGLAQGGQQAWADRFCYWPHIGLFVAVVWGVGELVDRLRLPAPVPGVVSAVALVVLAALTWAQVGFWRNTPTLWEHDLASTKDNHLAHITLGRYLFEKGRPGEAEPHLAEAVRLRPDCIQYLNSLGAVQLALGKLEEAVESLRQVVTRDATNFDAWHNVGVARLRQGKYPAAVRSFRRALELQPSAADSLASLGLALWHDGQHGEAMKAFEQALARDPGEPNALHGLSVAYLAQGRADRAAEALRQALLVRPQAPDLHSDLGVALGRQGQWAQAVVEHVTAVEATDQLERFLASANGRLPAPDSIPQGVRFRCRLAFALRQVGHLRGAAEAYRQACLRHPRWPEEYIARAWRLATDADADRRDPLLACELASQAIQAVEEPTASMLDALAAAQAARGDFADAVQTARQARDRASAAGDSPHAEAIGARLRLYQESRPAFGKAGTRGE
jgi:tetratricopeptide (TPR) repeat protein